MVDRVHLARPAPGGRRLLVRLCLFAFCGGLLLLLSSRPADAAERREPGLLDPVGTTLKATAREVDSLAGRATGSRSSAVGGVADAARKALAPPPRPSAGVARPAPVPAVRRGAPVVTSPVRRAAPPTRPAAPASRAATRARAAAEAATEPATKALAAPLDRAAKPAAEVAKVAGGPVARVAGGPLDRVARVAGGPAGRVAEVVAGPVLRPVGSALAPVGSALAPVVGPVAGLVPPVVPGGLLPLPGLGGPGTGQAAGSRASVPAAPFAGFDGTASATPRFASQTSPARQAADGASSPAARSIRSWPALTGAASLPGVPASAELPAGGPDPLSGSAGAGFVLAALAAALLALGLSGRASARPDGSGPISRSYLPLVSPA
jgi:hypothetical protein